MIDVRITMNVLPEKQKELVQTLLSMIGAEEKEAGCLSYALFRNIEDKNLLNLLEEWETREDLERHIRSERFSVLLGTKSLLAKPLEMKIRTVFHSEGVEVINAIRSKGTSKRSF